MRLTAFYPSTENLLRSSCDSNLKRNTPGDIAIGGPPDRLVESNHQSDLQRAVALSPSTAERRNLPKNFQRVIDTMILSLLDYGISIIIACLSVHRAESDGEHRGYTSKSGPAAHLQTDIAAHVRMDWLDSNQHEDPEQDIGLRAMACPVFSPGGKD
jgi:hypothetical protein